MSIAEKSKIINILRKEGKYDEAIDLLNLISFEDYDALMFCHHLYILRNQEKYDEALKLFSYLKNEMMNYGWLQNEVKIVTDQFFIKYCNKNNLNIINDSFKRINTENIGREQFNYLVMKYLGCYKKQEFNVLHLSEEVVKLNPETLNNSSEQDWTDRDRWFNIVIKYLIEKNILEKATVLTEAAINTSHKQRRHFFRMKSLILSRQHKYEEALIVLLALMRKAEKDAWLLRDIGELYFHLENFEKSKDFLLSAFSILPNNDFKKKASISSKLGDVFLALGEIEKASVFYSLYIVHRNENSWKVDEDLISLLYKSGVEIHDEYNFAELLKKSKEIINAVVSISMPKDNKYKVTGKIKGLFNERSFCFVNSEDGKNVYCSCKLFGNNYKNGDLVTVIVEESWDKTKECAGLKAIKVLRRDISE